MSLCKKILIVGALVLLVAVQAAGCGTGDTQQAPGNGESADNTYTVADAVGDWGFPAPYTHYTRGPGYVRMSFIFDTLVWKDESGFQGLLAEEWEFVKHENAYVFHLREDVSWHDGEDFTAEDVVFSFEYSQEHPYPWSDTSVVGRAEALDEHTVKVYLKRVYAPFMANVAGTFPIFPEHIYEDVQNPREFTDNEAATGTGPFKLADYDKEQGSYLYEANADYYLGRPNVDELQFVKVSEEMIPAALQDGTVNAGQIPPETEDKFEDDAGLKTLKSSHSWNAKLMFNHREEPFSSREFRWAIAHAVDREKLVEVSQRGYARKGSEGLLPPDNPWYASGIEKYSYDPEKSRELLEERGYSYENGALVDGEGDPVSVELLTKPRFDRDAELIQEDLEQLGLQVDLRSMEDKTVDSRITGWNFELALNGHGGLQGDPQNFNSFVLAKSFNSARYFQNEELVDLLERQVGILDERRLQQVVANAQRIYAQELPALTLYYPDWYWAHDGSVQLYNTPGGMALGIPLPLNKLCFVDRE